MEMSETGTLFVAILSLIITIVVLVKFFRLCADIRDIRIMLENKWGQPSQNIESPVDENRTTGSLTPTKADVREFQDIGREHMKANKGIDDQWLENLIASYNEKFNEDFHQYLKQQ